MASCHLFLGALKTNTSTKDINRKDAEKALGKWFTGARDRGGNRATRGHRSSDTPDNESANTPGNSDTTLDNDSQP